jgi:hypothetical protein
VKPELVAPALDGYDALAGGMLLLFLETRVQEDRGGRRHVFHRFVSRGGRGVPFELWGCAFLNGALRQFQPKGKYVPATRQHVYIKYLGKKPLDGDREQHTFEIVKPPRVLLAEDLTRLLADMTVQADALDRAIRLAGERDRERRAQGRPDMTPPADYDNEGVPF